MSKFKHIPTARIKATLDENYTRGANGKDYEEDREELERILWEREGREEEQATKRLLKEIEAHEAAEELEACDACDGQGFLEVCTNSVVIESFNGDTPTTFETWENQWCQECQIIMPDDEPPTIEELEA